MPLHSKTIGQGQPLVLVHGWGMNNAIWSDFLVQLAQDHQITCIELPGHGKSPWHTNQTLLSHWAQACLEVAPPTAIWLGWSLGGLIAQYIAIHAKNRVQRLICMTSTPCFQQRDTWPNAMPSNTLKLFYTALIENHQQTLERFLALQVMGQKQPKQLLKELKKPLFLRPEPQFGALKQGLKFLKQTDLRTQLGQIQCPQHWIFGGKDTLVPKMTCHALQQINPEARTTLIDSASHLPFLTHTSLCLKAIRS